MLASLASLLVAAASTAGQAGQPAVIEPVAAPVVVTTFDEASDEPVPRWTARLDYLNWWASEAPLPLPIVAAGNTEPGPNLRNPDTVVLFGGQNLDFGPFSGGRLVLGGWSRDGTVGVEVDAFMLERRSILFGVASDATGNPRIGLPYFNTADGFEQAFAGSLPGNRTADETAQLNLRLWGISANAVYQLRRDENGGLVLLAGFRYLDLAESFSRAGAWSTRATGTVRFLGTLLTGPGLTTTTADRFNTRNHFYGGQVGSRGEWRFGEVVVGVTGEVALGSMHQQLTIEGESGLFLNGVAQAAAPGGVFAQPSNIGRYERDRFCVIPQAEVNVGYQLTDSLRASVGYTFLYVSDIVRPGNNINRNINDRQTPISPAYSAVVVAVDPTPLFRSTDFWAHGVNISFEWRY